MWTCSSCGFENENDVTLCLACASSPTHPQTQIAKQDTSTQEPSQAHSLDDIHASSCCVAPNDTLTLRESVTGETVLITETPCLLGREGDLAAKLFSPRVSRKHLEITRDSNGTWLARHIGANKSHLITEQGRIEMQPEICYPIHHNDRLRLADQTFMVCIVPDKEAHETDVHASAQLCEQPTQQAFESGWFINCPVCGSIYHVQDEQARKFTCDHCLDPIDKQQIRHAVPHYATYPKNAVHDVY